MRDTRRPPGRGSNGAAPVTIARSLKELRRDSRSVVTVGTFDGVHLGHQSIIREVTARAKSRGGRSVVVTFEPHPREIVGRGPVNLITSLDERLGLIASLGADAILLLNFTREFSLQGPKEFFTKYVIEGVGVSEMVVGHDHMFGRDRAAGLNELKELGREFGFAVDAIEPVVSNGDVVSSSRIRELLLAGDVGRAHRYLGRPYVVGGTIEEGDHRGAALGFPTANVRPAPANKIVPAGGVYAVRALLMERSYGGMLNIGTRPTFNAGAERVVEVNLFGFAGEAYGRTIRIEMIRRLREEKKFPSAEALVAQLRRDREESLEILREIQPVTELDKGE